MHNLARGAEGWGSRVAKAPHRNPLPLAAALRPARAPAHWLGQLSNAISRLAGWVDVNSALGSLWRPLPLAAVDPLKVLGEVALGPSSVAGPQEQNGGAPRGRAKVWEAVETAGELVRRTTQQTLVTAEGGPHAGIVQRPTRGLASPEQPGEPARFHWPLPGENRKTLPTHQLGALTAGIPGGDPGVSGRTTGPATLPRAFGFQEDQQRGAQDAVRSPTGPRPGSPPHPSSPSPAGSREGRFKGTLVESGRNPRDELPDQAEAGLALLMRLTEARGGAGFQPSGASEGEVSRQASGKSERFSASHPLTVPGSPLHASAGHDVVRPAIARAFRAVVRRARLSPGQMGTLAVPSLRPPAQPQGNVGPGSHGDTEKVKYDDTQSVPASSTPSIPASQLKGITLLRESLSRSSVAQTDQRDQKPLDSSGPSGPSGSSAPSGSLVPGSEAGLVAAPAVQNTFNVTVHLAGGLDDGNEEALAERLTRILVEQARRYGIDV
jgi:hypothetical protein